MAGHKPYAGKEAFADSASTSKVRFDVYQEKKAANRKYQTSAASYGWLWEMAKLSREALKKSCRSIHAPLLMLQAENDSFVSAEAQQTFVERMKCAGLAPSRLVTIKGSKHEIYASGDRALAEYWKQIFDFLS